MENSNDVNQIETSQTEVPETPDSETTPSGEVEAPDQETPSSYSAEEYKSLQDQIATLQSEHKKQRRGLTSELRELKRKLKTSGTDQGDQGGDDDEVTVLRSQLVVAQLKEGARELVNKYEDKLSPSLKKAILRNPRGFVGSQAQDLSEGLEDIEEYILDEIDSTEETQPKKQVVVAGGNKPSSSSEIANSAKVNEILSRPVDEWTKEDNKIIDDFKASQT